MLEEQGDFGSHAAVGASGASARSDATSRCLRRQDGKSRELLFARDGKSRGLLLARKVEERVASQKQELQSRLEAKKANKAQKERGGQGRSASEKTGGPTQEERRERRLRKKHRSETTEEDRRSDASVAEDAKSCRHGEGGARVGVTWVSQALNRSVVRDELEEGEARKGSIATGDATCLKEQAGNDVKVDLERSEGEPCEEVEVRHLIAQDAFENHQDTSACDEDSKCLFGHRRFQEVEVTPLLGNSDVVWQKAKG